MTEIVVGTITLSNGILAEVQNFEEGAEYIDYSISNRPYSGMCILKLTVSSPENAVNEIKAALEEELVDKTKVDPLTYEEALAKLYYDQGLIQAAGYTCTNNIKLQVTESDLLRWTQLMVGIMSFQPPTVSIRDYNNDIHTVSLVDATQMLSEVFTWGQLFLADTWSKKDALVAQYL